MIVPGHGRRDKADAEPGEYGSKQFENGNLTIRS